MSADPGWFDPETGEWTAQEPTLPTFAEQGCGQPGHPTWLHTCSIFEQNMRRYEEET